ncbi:unnamed protein product [Rangifer tarandus platyrhynchus]|uniref:Uncharacterized protein n=2 Tax=Rangifer tarandus platyrhynchus TaxID=3082113 RepID=A0ABN8Z2L3_RANTA|nr:unnamed protein product [Rangifer tarandus platyrhynchus]
MNAPLVSGLEYYGPHLPTGPEQFLYYPTQLGPKLSEGSCQAFSPGHPLPVLSRLPLWAGCFFFQSQCWNLCCAEKRTGPRMPPRFPSEDTKPQAVLHLLPSVCTPMQAL